MAALKDFNVSTAGYLMLIPATGIVLLFSFLEKRKNRQDLCRGRPALIIPFHFLDGFENRAAYAVSFGTATGTVVSLITSENAFQMPLWANALYVYFQAMIGCLSCFPLFACLTTRYRAVGAILCIVYALLWLALSLIETVQGAEMASLYVWSNRRNSTILRSVNQTLLILSELPNLAYYLILIVHCGNILYKCYTTHIYFHKHRETTVRLHQEQHVMWVLHRFTFQNPGQIQSNHTSSQRFTDRMKDSFRLKYFTSYPFFKYPARMVALCTVQLNILYWVAIILILGTAEIIYEIVHSEFLREFDEQLQRDLTIMLSLALSIALIGSILNALAQIFVGARNYRYDMLRIYQGHRRSTPVSDMTPQNILTRNMTFPGYQVAFMLWGMVLCFITVFLLIFVPVISVYFAANNGVLADLASGLAQLLSFPATVLVMFYLTVFMTKQVLLQEKVKPTDTDPPLNVDNRKFYEIVSYYSLFTNMAVGVFACLFRILESGFFGLFFIGRLDRSIFPLELESWDRGFAAYTSMLLVDNAHNNPCMRVFAHLLWTKTLTSRLRKDSVAEVTGDATPLMNKPRHTTYGQSVSVDSINSNSSDYVNSFYTTKDTQRHASTPAFTRWHLAFTLINNPQLCRLRKQQLRKDADLC
ncbi:hypothetical protein BsWGS_05071 [Bradybaena similaris]